MSDKVRTPAEIQQEYGQVCAMVGEKKFQIEVMNAEVNRLYDKIVALGKEMESSKKSEAASGGQSVTSATASAAA